MAAQGLALLALARRGTTQRLEAAMPPAHGLQGFLAAQGLCAAHGLQGFLAAQGFPALQGLCAAHGLQGFLPAQGLHGFRAEQGAARGVSGTAVRPKVAAPSPSNTGMSVVANSCFL